MISNIHTVKLFNTFRIQYTILQKYFYPVANSVHIFTYHQFAIKISFNNTVSDIL